MDDNPPPYEDKHTALSRERKVQDLKTSNPLTSLDDQATASRSMLVSATADKILAKLEQRALFGISRTTLVVIPSGHGCDLSGPYKIAEFDEKPIVVELSGELNSVEFWSQTQAIDELRRQIAGRIGGRRGSMLSVLADEVHVRYETPFGLYDTINVMAMVVDIR